MGGKTATRQGRDPLLGRERETRKRKGSSNVRIPLATTLDSPLFRNVITTAIATRHIRLCGE